MLLALALACTSAPKTDDIVADTSDLPDTAATYSFLGREGADSVTYSGQVLRHLLILDMKAYLGALTERLDGGYFPAAGEVATDLGFYYRFDSATSGTVPILTTTDPATLQQVYDDIATGKDLASKIAGNDPAGEHEDWSTAFAGWSEDGVTSPESLVLRWFARVDEAAVAWSNGDIPLGPDGAPVPAVYVTAEGVDHRQLLQKFLTGAVTYAQATDDYLDDDVEGNGLLADHAALEEGKPYTTLEHAWDEAFGYFGAARDFGTWDDAAIASPGYTDTFSPDGAIDLTSEMCWGHATAAAKRDLGANPAAPTDFTATIWQGFVEGRTLLANTGGPLDDAQRAQLTRARDQVVGAWDAVIAASVVHYLNEVLAVTTGAGEGTYDFAAHAAAWSEMKGFALSLQFNPRARLTDDQFVRLHAMLGQAPVLPNADLNTRLAYAASLREARALLADAYAFDPANLGDDDGLGGW